MPEAGTIMTRVPAYIPSSIKKYASRNYSYNPEKTKRHAIKIITHLLGLGIGKCNLSLSTE